MPEFDWDDYFGSLKKTQTQSTLGDLIDNASAKTGVPKNLIGALIKQESGGNPNAVSSAGAYGLTQIMEGTWKDIQKETGLTDITDPQQQVDGGAYYLGKLIDRYGSVPLGLAAYNTGPGNVDKGRIPASTKRYVDNIMAMSERNLSDAKLRSPVRSPANELRQRLGELDRKAASGELSGSSGFDLDAYFKKMYPPTSLSQETGEPSSDFWTGLGVLARGVTELPGATFGAALEAYRGGEITAQDQTYIDKAITESRKRYDEYRKKYGDDSKTFLGFSHETLASLPQNMAFSIVSAIAGLGAGIPAAAVGSLAGTPAVGTAAGYATGATASGVAAYRMASDQFASSLRDVLNEESVKNRGRAMTDREWSGIKASYQDKIDEYGLWEALPEALSNAMSFGIIRMPVTKWLAASSSAQRLLPALARAGETLAGKVGVVAGKFGAMQVGEQSTETITGYGQGGLEAEMGLREKAPTFFEAFKEQAPQTFLLTTVMGGLGGAGSKLYDRLTKKGLQPTPAISPESDVAKRFDEPTFAGPLGLPAPQERLALPAPTPALPSPRSPQLALPAPEGIGEGFTFYDVPAYDIFSPELAQSLINNRLLLPAGQGFALRGNTEDVISRYSPELADVLRNARRQALPPGQGFEMHGEPYEPGSGTPPTAPTPRPKTWREAQAERRQAQPSPTVDLDDVLMQTDPGLRDYIEATRDDIENVQSEEDAVNVANQIKSIVNDAPPQAIAGLVQDLRRQLERLRVGIEESTIGVPRGPVPVPWKKAEQPTTATVPPPTQAAASQLQEQTVLDDSTLGQIEDRILAGEDMTNELKAVIAKQGRNVFQDWLNPQKMGARLAKKQAEETGVPLKDAYRSITDTMKRYEEAYRLVSEGKAKRTVPINKDLTELIKQIEQQELPGPGTPVQAPATESTIPKDKPTKTIPLNVDLRQLLQEKLGQQPMPEPGTPAVAPSTPEEFLKKKAGEKKDKATIRAKEPEKRDNLHVTKYPSGRYGFAGSVDPRLAWEREDGGVPTDEQLQRVSTSNFPGMVAKSEKLRTRVFSSVEEAGRAAHDLGHGYWHENKYHPVPEKQEPATDSEEFFEFKDDLNRRGAARTAQGVDYKIIQFIDGSYGYSRTKEGVRTEHRDVGKFAWTMKGAVKNAIQHAISDLEAMKPGKGITWDSSVSLGDQVWYIDSSRGGNPKLGTVIDRLEDGKVVHVRSTGGLKIELYQSSMDTLYPLEDTKEQDPTHYLSASIEIRNRTIEKVKPFLSPSQSEDALLATIEKYAKKAHGEVVIERSQLDYPASDAVRESDIEYLNKWDSGKFAKAVLNYIKEKEEFDKAPAPPPQQDFGADNKIFTKEKADKAREILRKKLSQVNMGLDPEMVQAGIDLAGYYIEGGARKFVDYAKRMIEDLGETAKPYLKSWYMGVRFYPGFDSTGMDGAAHVEALDVDALLGREEIGHEDATQETETRGDPGHPRGDRTLEGVPADNVPESERGGDVAEGSDKGGRADLRGAVRDDLPGGSLSPGVGDGEGEVHVSAGGRGTRGGRRRRDSSVGGVASDSGSHEPSAPGGRSDREPSGKTENEGYPPQTAPASDHAPFRDYTITDLTQLGEGGQKTKYRNNVAAIRLLRDLEATGRKATAAEQDILARYVGWGGLPQAFDAENEKWSAEYAELKDLLEDDEYQSAFQSTQYAHYTSDTVIRGIYRALKHLGFSGGSILEPGCGVGNFAGLMPEALRTSSRFIGIERERIAAGIAKHLYPNQNMLEKDFTYFNVPNETFDLTVGNPPFGKTELTDMSGRKHLTGLSIHNYFISKAVEMTRPGGLIAVVVSRFFMDAKSAQTRRYLGDRTRLLGAIRLPNTAFTKNAGTEVTTDIIFLQKRPESEFGSRIAKEEAKAWMDTGNIADPHGREDIEINQYYIDHPEMLMGRMERTGSMRGAFEPTLAPNPDVNLSDAINEAIKQLPKDVFEARTGENTRTILDATAMKLESPDVDPHGHFVKDDKLYKRIDDFEGAAYAIEIKPETMFSEKEPYGKSRIERIKQLASIRFTTRALIAAETRDDMKQANKLRKKLNQQYDAFAAKNGPINKKSNLVLIRDDPDVPLLMALEMDFDKGITKAAAKKQGIDPVEPSAAKSPIFLARVVPKKEIPTSADTPQDAIMISLAERGHIDAGFVGELLNQDGEKVLSDMAEKADSILFLNPATREYELRDAYLSGNVRRKLHEAERAGMVKNIEALTKVIPEDVPPHEIQGFIGSPWIPTKVYEDFIKGLLGEEATVSVKYVPVNSSFVLKVENSSDIAEQTTFGTARCPATRILNSLLNSKEIKVTETDRDGKVTVLQDETDNANDKAREIKDRFADWLFAEDLRSEQVTRAFNDANNNYVKRQYDGSWLAFAGKVADNIIKFRRHQNNGIARIIQSRTSLLDHVVGSGKTFTMISAAMEMKRMGIIQKPLFTVPNHLVKQWAAEFYRLYPGAKILAATKKDFERKNRRAFLAKVATGNWDAVIMAHSSFGFIRPDPAVEKMVNEKMIKEISAAINSIMGDNADADGELDKPTRRTVKQLAQMRERLENRLKRLRDKPIDDIMDFEQLGFDQLFVDEAHLFKNLLYFTKQTNISGLGNEKGSQRAWDMYLKVQQIFHKNGRDQGVVFATGTPVSNSLAEMYHMMRYLMPTAMEENGYTSFDAWANTYAEVTQEWMQSFSGIGYKQQNRMSTFVNALSLLAMFDQVADTVSNDDLKKAYAEDNNGKEFPLPKLKGGKRQAVSILRSEAQKAYMENVIAARAEALKTRKGKPKKGDDNSLWVMTDARKAAMDMRLVDPTIQERDPNGRIAVVAEKVAEFYKKYTDVKGTQLVFSDMGTPRKHAAKELKVYQELQDKAAVLEDEEMVAMAELGDEAAMNKIAAAEDAAAKLAQLGKDYKDAIDAAMRGFSIYDDLKDALVELGIPEREIAFIHDYNTDDQKAALFAAVNQGRIRVLLGSTPKLGAGTNVQERLVALHHVDIPWKPSDVEQREGRIIRQGNRLMDEVPNFEVEILSYATQDTLDLRMWQTQEKKLSMIAQLRDRKVGNIIENAFEDMILSAEEMQAAASSNPYILQDIQIRDQIKKLERQRRSHEAQVNELKRKKRNSEQDIKSLPEVIENREALERGISKYKDALEHRHDDFAVTINGERFTDVEQAGNALQRFVRSDDEEIPVKIQLEKTTYTNQRELLEACFALINKEMTIDPSERGRTLAMLAAQGKGNGEVVMMQWGHGTMHSPLFKKLVEEINAQVKEFKKENKGKWPPPISVEFNGETYKSRTKLSAAYRDIVGDLGYPILWTAEGRVLNQQKDIVRHIESLVEKANRDGKTVEVGQFGDIVVEVSPRPIVGFRGEETVYVTLRYKDKSIQNYADIPKDEKTDEADYHSAAVNVLNAAKAEIDNNAWRLGNQIGALEKAHKNLAELGKMGEQGAWAKDGELQNLRQQHREVLRKLADLEAGRGHGEQKQAADSPVREVAGFKILNPDETLTHARGFREYYATYSHEGGSALMRVSGKPVTFENAPGIKFFTYQSETGNWHVIDQLTGTQIFTNKSQTQALMGAEGILDDNLQQLKDVQETFEHIPQPGGATDIRFFLSEGAPAKSASSVSRTEILSHFAKIARNWKNRPKIYVVQSESQLPKVYAPFMVGQEGDVYGFYDPTNRSAWFIADNMPSLEQAELTLFHEVLGHHGVREFVGKDFDAFLDQVYRHFGKFGLGEIARRNGLDLNTVEGQRAAADEKLADMAQKGTNQNWLQKAWVWVKNWLRKHGWTIKPSYGDFVDVVRRARETVVAGERLVAGISGGPMAMVAWHGSPHKYDKVDLAKVGTGEGAQAYGWGYYAADLKSVAQGYKDRLAPGGKTWDYIDKNGDVFLSKSNDMEQSLNSVQSYLFREYGNSDYKVTQDVIAKVYSAPRLKLHGLNREDLLQGLKLYKEHGLARAIRDQEGHLYKLDIPESHQLLDWDKPLSEQPEGVRKALIPWYEQMSKRGGISLDSGITYLNKTYTGTELYRKLSNELGSPQAASEYLRSIGIPGHRYLDQGSRQAGKGTYNYVIYDAELVKIQERDGIRFSLRTPIEVVSDRLKNNLSKQGIDVTFGNTKQLRPIRDGMLRLPYWLAKTNETVKKFFNVERERMNSRATMLHDDLQDTQSVFTLDDKQTKELSDVAFGMEKNGARIQKDDIKVSKFVRVGDRQITIGRGTQQEIRTIPTYELNEAHYQALDKYLTSKGISPAVRQAYIATRKKLDGVLLRIHDNMSEMAEVDPSLVSEYRRQIGRINFYFPHNRYGNAFVQVLNADKEVLYRQHFNAVGETNRVLWFNKNKAKIEAKLKELNKDVDLASLKWKVARVEGLPEEVYDFPIPVDAMQQIIDAGVERVALNTETNEEWKAFSNRIFKKYKIHEWYIKNNLKKLTPDEVAEYKRLRSSSKVSEQAVNALRSAMSEAVSDVMKSRGFGSHMIERKNIPGFERENMQRVLFDYLAGYSGWLTKMDAARQYGKMLGQIEARKTPNDYSWAVKYTKDMLENATLWDRVADSARGAFFVYYLGFNLKTAAVNLTQNIVAGVPRLSMEGKGAFTAWAKALKDLRLAISESDIQKSQRFNNEEKQFISDMLREGWGLANFVSEVTGKLGGPTKTITSKAIKAAGLPMAIAEKYNRLSLGVAAFRMARSGKIKKHKGTALTYDAAKAFAEEIVEDAHFVYGKGNRPGVFRGNEMAKMVSTTYTFRTFTHNLLSLWRWMITQGGKDGALAFAYSLGGIILLGGMSAAPLYQTLATLFRQMFGDDYLRKMTRDMAPNQLRDIVSYGVPSLVGVNIGGSLGMEVPVLDRYRADQKPSEQLWRGMFEVSGIPGSMLTSFFDNVIGGLASGNPSKLADFILPTAGQNIKRAYELYTHGQYTQTGRPISLPGTQDPIKLTGGQALGKVLGFQPTAMTKGYDIYRTKEDLEGYKRRHQSAMVDAYMRAKNRGDLEGMQRVREKVAEWNKTAIASGNRQNIIDITKSVKTRSRPDRGPKAFRAKAMEIEEAYR